MTAEQLIAIAGPPYRWHSPTFRGSKLAPNRPGHLPHHPQKIEDLEIED